MNSENNNKGKMDTKIEHTEHSESCACKKSKNGTPNIEIEEPE